MIYLILISKGVMMWTVWWCCIISLTGSLVLAQPLSESAIRFQCGQDVCERKGFFSCVSPPLVNEVSDSYCLDCVLNIQSCGTVGEVIGCHLYCQAVMLNNSIIEREKLEKQTHDLKNLLVVKENKVKALIVTTICISVGSGLGLLLVALIFITKRVRKVKKSTGKKEKVIRVPPAAIPLISSSQDSEIADSSKIKDTNKHIKECAQWSHVNECYGEKVLKQVQPVETSNVQLAVGTSKSH